ncbi:MAG: peptidase dimerization domain-containing protein, partial [Candidatus Competibacteraceae bacterium]|nr:peptidase dimerization domain-containing protein [Candidatus Competibacteraceae bacterium]
KGSGNWTAVVRGRAAHAGREHHLGRNAVVALAGFVTALDGLNGQREGVTVNPARFEGGGPTNVVPDRAGMRFNIRVQNAAQQTWVEKQLIRLTAEINARDGIQLALHGGFGRPPKPRFPALFQFVSDCGRQLDLPVRFADTGGCCDGNNLAAHGLPNVDTLGVRGGAIHSADEYLLVDSLVERARLSALLLMRLGAGDCPEDFRL